MHIAYTLIAVAAGVPSALLGMFFLGSAGLSVSGAPMTLAWSVWSVGVLAATIGIGMAVRRLSIAGLIAMCCVPIGLAAGLAQLTLGFGR